MSHRERGEGTVHDMQGYLVTEFIEEYEDGTLDRVTLERRIVGILGPGEAARVLEGVPVRPLGAEPQNGRR